MYRPIHDQIYVCKYVSRTRKRVENEKMNNGQYEQMNMNPHI